METATVDIVWVLRLLATIFLLLCLRSGFASWAQPVGLACFTASFLF